MVDYYVEENTFRIPEKYNEFEIVQLINIFTKYLLQCKEETGTLDENLVALSALAGSVLSSMEEEDILVST